MNITKEQLDKLLEKRQIEQSTYDSIPQDPKLVTDMNTMSTDAPAMDITGMEGAELAKAGLPTAPVGGAGGQSGVNINLPDVVSGMARFGLGVSDAIKVKGNETYAAPTWAEGKVSEPKELRQKTNTAQGAVLDAAETQKRIMETPTINAAIDASNTGLTAQDKKFMSEQVDQAGKTMNESERLLTQLATKVRVNPQEYMQSLSGGQKTMAIVGLVLGGIGAGITGQPNAALQILNKRIEENIKAQEVNISNNLAQIKELNGLSAQRVKLAGENTVMRAQAQIIELTKLKSHLEFMQKYANTQTQKEQALVLIQKIEQQLQESMLKYDEMTKGMINNGFASEMNMIGMAVNNTLGLQLQDKPRYNLELFKGNKQSTNTTSKEPVKVMNKATEEPKKESSFLDSFTKGFTKAAFGNKD